MPRILLAIALTTFACGTTLGPPADEPAPDASTTADDSDAGPADDGFDAGEPPDASEHATDAGEFVPSEHEATPEPPEERSPVLPPDDDESPSDRLARTGSPYATSPRWRRVFSEDFEPPASSGDPCYTTTPKCAYGVNQQFESCRPEHRHAGLADLNKCRWTVLSDYSIWSNRTSTFDPGLVRVEDGELVLSAAKNVEGPYDCGTPFPEAPWQWTSTCAFKAGAIQSKPYADAWGSGVQPGYAHGMGRFEIRGRISSGPGSFPAYWLWPDGAHWNVGEIDIMEYVAPRPTQVVQTIHGLSGSNHASSGGWMTPTPAHQRTFLDDYHTYAAEWDASGIRFFIDNRETRRIPASQVVRDHWNDARQCTLTTAPDWPFYFILNDGITTFSGGEAHANANWSSFTHKEGRIDWVRVSERCAEGDTSADCVESTLNPLCRNPCDGLGRFDGYNCWLRGAPTNYRLYESDGRLRYRRRFWFTSSSDCQHGDTFVSGTSGCDAGPVPAGRSWFPYENGFYVTSVCSTTDGLPNCAKPCPLGGSYDSRSCHLFEAPAGVTPFEYDRKFYYAPVAGHPDGPCPHRVGGHRTWHDGANCYVDFTVPAGVTPFVYGRSYYFAAACGNAPDWQRLPAGDVGSISIEHGCGPL